MIEVVFRSFIHYLIYVFSFFGGVASCSVLFVLFNGKEGAISIRLKFFIKTTELTMLLCRKGRIFEMYFDLIKLSLKPKYYFTENRIRLI